MDLRLVIALFCAISYGCAHPQDLRDNSVELENESISLFKWKDVSKKRKELQNLIENEVQPLLTSVHTATIELNSVLADIEVQKQAFDNYRSDFSEAFNTLPVNCLTNDLVLQSNKLGKWNFKNCGNFTDDCIYGAKLALNGSIVALHIGLTTSNIVVEVTNCPSWNLIKAYRCYETNVQKTLDLITYIKTEGVPIIEKAVVLAKKLPPDFKKCIGIAVQSNLMLTQNLNLKCEKMYGNFFPNLQI